MTRIAARQPAPRRGAALTAAALLALVGLPWGGSATAAPSFAAAPTCFGQKPTILGTPGPDRLQGTNGPDVISGGDGDDVIRGLKGDDRLCGGDGDDVIVGDLGADRLDGGASGPFGRLGDLLSGGAGDDQVRGDLASMVDFRGSPVGVVVDLAAGTASGPGDDRLSGVGGVIGSRFADTLRGDARVNVLIGLGGPDTLAGRVGRDLIWPDSSPSIGIASDRAADTVVGADEGSSYWGDTVESQGGADRVRGTTAADTIRGEFDGGVLVGDDGTDIIRASGSWTGYGGEGSDTLFTGSGIAVMHGGPGDDSLVRGRSMYGELGDDSLLSASSDTAYSRIVSGGPGTDTSDLWYPFGQPLGHLDERFDLSITPSSYRFRVDGGPWIDTAAGDIEALALANTAEVTVVVGTDQTDLPLEADLLGDLDADLGAGDDRLTMRFNTYADPTFVVDAGPGDDDVEGETYEGSGRILGGDGDDVLVGTGHNNIIEGGAGNDEIDAGFGVDHVLGGPGDDVMSGGEDNDGLFGGPGVDTADGGSGTDRCVTETRVRCEK